MPLSRSHQVLAFAGLSVGLLIGGGIAVGDLKSVEQTSPTPAPTIAQPTAVIGLADTIYVRPVPAPAVIHVTKPASTLPPQVVRVVVPGVGGGEGDDNGGDDNGASDGG